jgi:ATP:ADP antiporter, AAA family
MAIMVIQAAQRTANFAVSNPAREILFTAADRADKYKAKNVVDGVVFRGADMASSWVFTLLHVKLALGVPLIAAVMIPISLGWIGLSFFLGRQQEKRARAHHPSPSP